MRPPPALVVAGCLLLSASARSESVRLEPSADNTLFEDVDGDTSNGSGPALFVGRNNQGRARRALIVFDVASAIPPGATVDSAVLVLHVSNSSDLMPRALTVHRVTSPWGEGASSSSGGTGAEAAWGDASWTCAFYPDRLWQRPGGDFERWPSASQFARPTGICAWSGPGLVADLRTWLAQPSANDGWVVVGDESEPGTARRFDSREHPDGTVRPSLTVHFSPSRSSGTGTWGSIKAAYR
jgi:hypothetical protein